MRRARHPELAEVARLQRRFPPGRGVIRGIGDDCAVVRGAAAILLKCDPVVAGVHFAAGTRPALIGRKALNRALSDIAAMGGVPRYALVSALLPRAAGRRTRDGLWRGLAAAAAAAGVSIVGGDLSTTPGPLALVVTVTGEPGAGAPPGRDRARPGDLLFVTGPLGGSIRGHHLRFSPRLREGQWLARRHRPSAMMDISDGLLIDLYRILRASSGRGRRLGAVLDAAAIPVSAAAVAVARGTRRTALEHALTDGEDYELLFAVAPHQWSAIARDARLPAPARHPIGCIRDRPGIWLRRYHGSEQRLEPAGHEHQLLDDAHR